MPLRASVCLPNPLAVYAEHISNKNEDGESTFLIAFRRSPCSDGIQSAT